MSDCAFCELILHGLYDQKVNGCVIFEPLNPVTPGHMLVVPVTHVEDAGVSSHLTERVMGVAAELASRLTSFNIITSKGSAATQTVPHFHVHVVPRATDDGLSLPWTGQAR